MHLTPLEIMSSLIAAVTHDLDHPGVNQPFLIATSNHLAALYEVRLWLFIYIKHCTQGWISAFCGPKL